MKNLTIGENILLLRKRQGLKQYELAEKVGITALTLVRIETGQSTPQSTTLKCIADALGVSVDELKGEG